MMADTAVRLCSNGRYWLARWRDNAGNPASRSLGNKKWLSKRRAHALCQRIATEHFIQPGRRDGAHAPPLELWLDRFLALRTDLAPSTQVLYQQTTDKLLSYFAADLPIDKIGRQQAAEFRAWLSKIEFRGRPATEETVRKHIRNCKTMFGARHGALSMDLIPFSPFDRQVGATPRRDTDWHYVTLEDLDTLLEVCPDSRWRAMLGLCRLAGLRRGEAMRLALPDIDWDRRRLTVLNSGRQTTKRRTREVPIVPRLYGILMERLEDAEPGDKLVVDVSEHNLGTRIAVIVKRAGFELWSKPYHTLRKNCETDWLATEPVMDVCSWLGHDPAVAAKHYHQVKADTMDRVTGVTAEQEQSENERLRAEVERLKAQIEAQEAQKPDA